MLTTGERVNALGDLEFALGCVRHALLVDGHGHDVRPVLLRQAEHEVRFFAPALEVERVQHGPTRIGLERGFEHVALGAVENQRRLDRRPQALDDLDHLMGFVGALGERHADVEQVRAAFDLVACNPEHVVVRIRQQQALHFAAALGIDAFADERGRRILAQIERADRARRARPRSGDHTRARRMARYATAHALQMLETRATAAADRVHAEVLDELGQRLGQPIGIERVQRFAAAEIDRDPRVRDHADRSARVLDQIADRLAHVLRPR